VPAAARADGDPASDVLISQDVFVPYSVKLPPAEADQLTRLIHNAKAQGFRIKVALIASPYDLGSVTPLWRHPQRYARFLSEELFFVYKGRLLIVMPNGYGIYHRGKSLISERELLQRLPTPEAAGADVAVAATTAVRRLAGSSGINLALPAVPAQSPSKQNRWIFIAPVVGGAWLLFAAVLVLRRRRHAAASATRAGDET
jgi:hypothetical protein